MVCAEVFVRQNVNIGRRDFIDSMTQNSNTDHANLGFFSPGRDHREKGARSLKESTRGFKFVLSFISQWRYA